MMLKIGLLIFAVCLLSFSNYAQSKALHKLNNTLDIHGSEGRNLLITEKESFQVTHLFSEHYVDSMTMIPYTGLITIDYHGKAIDSIYAVNGYKNGICLNYITGDTVIKSELYYYDQLEGISILRSFPYSTKKHTKKEKYNYLSIRFFSGEVSVRIHCVKHKETWLVDIYENDSKSKREISSLDELKQLIGSYKSDVNILELLNGLHALEKL